MQWLNAGVLLAVSFLVLAGLSLRPEPGSEAVAAVFPPWWSGERAFAAAAASSAAILRTGALATIVVVRPTADRGLARLKAAGALFVVNPLALGGCLAR